LQPPAPIAWANEAYGGDNSQKVSPATGLSSATVPMGWQTDGLPMGIQFLARPWAEDVLLALSAGYEAKTLHRQPPKGYPALTRDAVRTSD
ncbi:MAG: hypothetical protein ABJJ37_00575, partial [Roseibium sp.]